MLFAFAVAPAAGEDEVSTVPRQELPASGLAPAGETLELALDEAVAIALERNLDLLIERYDRAQFRLRLGEALGIYDLQIDLAGFVSEETSPSVSELAGADILVTERQNLNTEISQLTPWGGVGSFRLNAFRQEDNSIFSNPNPFYQSDADVIYNQPLLRSFGRLTTERGIRIARLNSATSREVFEQQVAQTIQQVENAYWALVEAREQLVVARESLDLARELHDMNRIRVDVGTLAPLELVQSEAGIAIRQEEIIRSEASVGDAEDELRRLLNLEDGPLWNAAIVPTTDPETERVEIDLEQAIATAFRERPELAARVLQNQVLEVESRFFRNQLLPRLDLGVRYGYNAAAGDLRDNGTIIDTGGLGDAFEQLLDREFEGWRIDLLFGVPLQNRTARARAAIAAMDLDQGEVELDQLHQTVRTEVRGAVRGLRRAAEQIDSARASVNLAERNLEAERKRYENGLSTSFQVLEIQEDLTAARSRLVSAITAYRRALVELQRSTGQLLAANDVEMVDPLAADEIHRLGWRIGLPGE
ncbi:MAG TPA: TolC family protein [Thermoanaerobaculia bacterium]|nr:TolC family protein [Thermoanaerobaculia bacterium]